MNRELRPIRSPGALSAYELWVAAILPGLILANDPNQTAFDTHIVERSVDRLHRAVRRLKANAIVLGFGIPLLEGRGLFLFQPRGDGMPDFGDLGGSGREGVHLLQRGT